MLADANLLAVAEEGMADAHAAVTAWADHHYLGGVQRRFALDDTCLASTLSTLGVLLYNVNAFYQDRVVGRAYLAHTALFASVFAGYHQHGVILFDVHPVLLTGRRTDDEGRR